MSKPHTMFNNNLNFVNLSFSLACMISYALNKSILWAILHGICGFFYVFYYLTHLSSWRINV